MPTARPAGALSRPGSRVPSRMGRPASAQAVPSAPVNPNVARPASTRPYQPGRDFAPARPGDEDLLRYGVPSDPRNNPHNNAFNNTNVNPSALEIDIHAPSVEEADAEHNGPRSLAATDEDLFNASGNVTPKRQGPSAPLKSPFKASAQKPGGTGVTPAGLAASVPLPQSRAPSALGWDRPGSKMARGEESSLALNLYGDHEGHDAHDLALEHAQKNDDDGGGGGGGEKKKKKHGHGHRAPEPPLTAAVYETPWFHRTQYGKHDPPVVVSTLKLKLVNPPAPPSNTTKPVNLNSQPIPGTSQTHRRSRSHTQPQPLASGTHKDMHKTPKREPSEVHVRTPKSQYKTPIANNAILEIESSDEHVHGHVHEVVGEEPDIMVAKEEPEKIADEESYGHVDDDADIGHHVLEHYDVVDNQTYRSTTPKANAVVLSSQEKLDSLPETEIVDVDVENMNERQLVEHLKTPAMMSEALDDYTEEVQRALQLHHDEDLCVLLQAAEDELQHPVVRKAVRKAVAGRLRKLGLTPDYDVGSPDGLSRPDTN